MHRIDRANAVTNLITHLSAHPQLSRALPLQNHHQWLPGIHGFGMCRAVCALSTASPCNWGRQGWWRPREHPTRAPRTPSAASPGLMECQGPFPYWVLSSSVKFRQGLLAKVKLQSKDCNLGAHPVPQAHLCPPAMGIIKTKPAAVIHRGLKTPSL